MRNPALILAGLLPVVVVLLLMETQETSAQLCPLCTCPPHYRPVCGKRKDTGEEKDFTSICVLRCSNQCTKHGYLYVKKGLCKKNKPTNPSENDTLDKNERLPIPARLKKLEIPAQ